MKAQVLTVICPDCNLALPVVGGIAAHPGEGCEDFRVEAEVFSVGPGTLDLNELEFQCPKCGGYKWGTSGMNRDFSVWVGRCHGSDVSDGCGFTWPRSEDGMYFVPREGGTACGVPPPAD